nr:unnamed protein product [Digitaria exilis]
MARPLLPCLFLPRLLLPRDGNIGALQIHSASKFRGQVQFVLLLKPVVLREQVALQPMVLQLPVVLLQLVLTPLVHGGKQQLLVHPSRFIRLLAALNDDDTIQPTNSNGRSNASATSIDPTDARSDRRLNWSNEEDIRLEAPKKRPIGRDKAKEERKGKRKEPEAIVAIGEKLDKFMEATTKAEKIAQVQQNLADKKLEVAKEQTKSKMLDLYKELLCAPTSELSEEAKAERSKALELMASAIFSKDN